MFKQMWDGLRVKMAFGALVKDPEQTDRIFEVASILLKNAKPEQVAHIAGRAMSKPGFKAQYESRYAPPAVNLESLSKLPEGTLGRAFATHLQSNGLDPNFYPALEIHSEITFLAMRARQTHDIWHVLTGYGTSVEEELALQAFTFAQLDSGLSAIILSGGILHLAQNSPRRLRRAFDLICDGYIRGKTAGFLLGERWEERWSESLETLRVEMGIHAGEGSEEISHLPNGFGSRPSMLSI